VRFNLALEVNDASIVNILWVRKNTVNHGGIFRFDSLKTVKI